MAIQLSSGLTLSATGIRLSVDQTIIAPVANFSAIPTSGTPPLTTTFTDTSTNSPTSWLWNFGDGNTSTSQNPVHIYSNAGTYTVSLTATNAAGSNTKTVNNLVSVSTPAFSGTVTLKTTPVGYLYNNGYGNNTFVAYVYSSSSRVTVATTDLGDTWTQGAEPASSGYWGGLAFGAGKFVAVLDQSSTAMYSTDGVNWTASGLPASTRWYTVGYLNNMFLATGSGPTAATSVDGVNWSSYSLPSNVVNWDTVAFGNGTYVVAGGQGYRAYSTTGLSGSWTIAYVGSGRGFANIAYGNGVFVAPDLNVSGFAKYTWTSTDGINWTQHANAFNNSVVHRGIAYGNGVFVACYETTGQTGGGVEYSTDGINWTNIPSAEVTTGGGWRDVTYGNGVFLVTGTGARALIIS